MEQQPAPSSLTSVSEIGEFGLIARMRAALGDASDENVLAGIADDAAVYRAGEDKVHVVTTDALVEGVHFDRSFMPMAHLGVKALAVNASDIVAMNARPRYATVTIGLPQNVYVEQVEALYSGLRQACELYGMTIVGGDTVSSRQLTLSVTAIGEAEEADIVYRRGAKPGDALCVTGDLGAAYAGLKVLVQQRERLQQEGEGFQPDLGEFQYVVGRQLAPTARLKAIQHWKEKNFRPHALIDVSDGLASEVHHLCEAGGVGMKLFGSALPVVLETRTVADRFEEDVDVFALFGGEDYELLFTAPPEACDRLDAGSFSVIGEVAEADAGVRLHVPGGETVALRPGGFDHFEGSEGAGGEA